MSDSTFLVKSTKNKSFGTAFSIDHDANGSFLLTCEHVVEACGKDDLEINGHKAEFIISTSTNELIDLAVVYVKGLQTHPLKLSLSTLAENATFSIDGFKPHKQGEYKEECLEGSIKKISQIHSESQSIDSYELYIGEDDNIEKGYSGSAIVSKKSGQVVAVATDRVSTGKQAYAIPLKYLKEVWSELNPKLFDTVSPFVGLSAFGREDRAYFFGRDEEIKEISKQIKTKSLVAVIGDSGSGKSSLIKAGVIPKLLDFYDVIETRPAKNPFSELAHVVAKVCAKRGGYSKADIGYFRKEIKSEKPQSVHTVFEELFTEDDTELLLYIDQFEELFTLCSEEVQQSFMETLLFLLNHQSSHLQISIIFSMRRDYYNLLATHKEFDAKVQDATYLVKRMKDENLREVIEKPLDLLDVDEFVIKKLSSVILEDMGDESKEITLLQIALTETWERKSESDHDLLASYINIGKVTGALSTLAMNAMQSLDETEKELFKYIFIRIVKFSDMGGITRRLADRSEFSDEAWELVQRLASVYDNKHEKYKSLGRLLKLRNDKERGTKEVTELIHEALVTQWSIYVSWLRDINKDNKKRIHDALIDKSKIYKKNPQSKFLLTGYTLEESSKLLDKDYRLFLSSDERAYVEASKKREKKIQFWKWTGIFSLVVLLALSGYFWFEAEKSRQNNVKITKNLLKVIDEIFHKKITKTEKYTLIVNTLKNSSEPKILRYVAHAYYKKRRYTKAIEVYKKIQNEHINDYWFHMELGKAYGAKKNFKDAILEYDKAIELNDKKHDAYRSIGYSYRRVHDYDKSIELYHKAILINIEEEKIKKNNVRLKSNRYKTYEELALTYQKIKNYDKAIRELEHAIVLLPKKYDAYIFLFQMYLEKNEAIPVEIEASFLKIFENDKKRMLDYEIVKAFQKVLNNEEVDLAEVLKKYSNIHLRHENYHRLWIDRMSDEVLQQKCYKVHKAFVDRGRS